MYISNILISLPVENREEYVVSTRMWMDYEYNFLPRTPYSRAKCTTHYFNNNLTISTNPGNIMDVRTRQTWFHMCISRLPQYSNWDNPRFVMRLGWNIDGIIKVRKYTLQRSIIPRSSEQPARIVAVLRKRTQKLRPLPQFLLVDSLRTARTKELIKKIEDFVSRVCNLLFRATFLLEVEETHIRSRYHGYFKRAGTQFNFFPTSLNGSISLFRSIK